MTNVLVRTFCTSLAIFGGGIIAMMIGAVAFAPYVQIVIGVSALCCMVSLFLLERGGKLDR